MDEIEERLALIGALAEDAQAGFEAMLVPFLVYGISIPLGTAATYCFVHLGLSEFVWGIWLAVIGFCQIFLPLYFRRERQIKIQRASDRIFAVLWGGIGFIIVLDFVLAFFGKLAFPAVFFIIGISVALGCAVSGTLVQKKSPPHNVCGKPLLAFVRAALPFCRAVYGAAHYQRSNLCAADNSRLCELAYYAKKEDRQ